ncbi:hypothetical protein OHA70_11600 [Kribbella sp. NBC_00382]|uniref:hypothetical protein n=1 Tax=Kribbella sp. NBC_00382 TaxID=2975967 RepID=UPI002E221E0C
MISSQRVLRLAAQISLLVALAGTSTVLLLRPYLDDDGERIYRQGTVSEVTQGPVTIDHIQWKLESLEVYTQLVDQEKKKITLEQPAGSVVILATIALTPLPGVSTPVCSAKLRDDRGNLWESQYATGLALPTSCTDDEHPFKLNRTDQLAQVFVVPESAVPHLTGIQVENQREYRRVLITR